MAPQSREKAWEPSRPAPGRPAVLAALGANAAVFGLWQASRGQGGRWLSSLLHRHATCSYAHLRGGRVHTLLTSAASHQVPLHFAVNAYGLYLFGSLAGEALSPRELGATMAVCGAGSSACHVLAHPRTAVLGASGMLMGVVTVAGLLEPERHFRMLFPLPGLTLSMLQVADLALLANLLGFVLLRRWIASVAWAAHLGGTAAGLGVACGARLQGDCRFEDPVRVHAQRCGADWLRTGDSARSGAEAMERLLRG